MRQLTILIAQINITIPSKHRIRTITRVHAILTTSPLPVSLAKLVDILQVAGGLEHAAALVFGPGIGLADSQVDGVPAGVAGDGQRHGAVLGVGGVVGYHGLVAEADFLEVAAGGAGGAAVFQRCWGLVGVFFRGQGFCNFLKN